MEFEDLKAEFSQQGTTPKRKDDLIHQMQKFLQDKCGSDPINCLDGKTYSTSSKNVEDLYAIYGAFKSKNSQEEMSDKGNIARQKAFEQNKFSPENQYPGSK